MTDPVYVLTFEKDHFAAQYSVGVHTSDTEVGEQNVFEPPYPSQLMDMDRDLLNSELSLEE